MRPIRSPFDFDFLKGGQGSGNHGHAGRPGERGGSAQSNSTPVKLSPFARNGDSIIWIDDDGKFYRQTGSDKPVLIDGGTVRMMVDQKWSLFPHNIRIL